MTKDLIKPQEFITSLELAELTGKKHKNVMRDIREMEPDWTKTCGLKFEPTSRVVQMPNGGTRIETIYLLNKLESLYIITKYNNEARAKLVLRWAELERQQQELQQQLMERQSKLISRVEAENETLLPLAEKYTLTIPHLGAMPVDAVAKIYASHGIDTGRTRIYKAMRRANMVCKDSGRNHCKPTQHAVEAGLLKMAVHLDTNGNIRSYPTSLITAKGLDFLASLLKEEQNISIIDTLQLTINFNN